MPANPLRFFEAENDMADVKALCQKFSVLVEKLKKGPDTARMGVDGAPAVLDKLEALKADGEMLLRLVKAQLKYYSPNFSERRFNDTWAFGRSSNVSGALKPVRAHLEQLLLDLETWLLVEKSRSQKEENVGLVASLVEDGSEALDQIAQKSSPDYGNLLTLIITLSVLFAKILKKK